MKSYLYYLLLFTALIFMVSCGDRVIGTGSVETPPGRRLATFTEWLASEPQFKQRGEFYYNEQDRLERYEFWSNRGGEEWTNTIYITFHYEKGRLIRRETYVWLDKAWRHTEHVTYEYNGQDEVEQVLVEVDTRNYPVRKEFTVTNTSTPDAPITFVTIYTYVN